MEENKKSIKNKTKKEKINKKALFASEYIKDQNAAQAAIRAGYSAKTARAIGNNLKNDPEVQEYIEENIQNIMSENIADAIEVLEYYTSVIRGEARAPVLALDGKKQIVLEKAPDHKERLEAAKQLAKFHQLFTEKISIEGVATVIFQGEDSLKD